MNLFYKREKRGKERWWEWGQEGLKSKPPHTRTFHFHKKRSKNILARTFDLSLFSPHRPHRPHRRHLFFPRI